MTVLALISIGVFAGVVSGLLGVGGGIVLVPGLVLVLGLTQHHAEGTSLVAIVPVVLVGAVSQRRYGNVRGKDALLLGGVSIGGATAGVVLANALSGQTLRIAFAVLMLLIAATLVRRTLRAGGEQGAGASGGADAGERPASNR